MGSCRVLLAVIGQDWVNARDAEGRPRLENPNDWVRVEIESALRRPKVLVIPVLIDGATMPRVDQLPVSWRSLGLRQAVEITASGFANQVETLITTLKKILEQPSVKSPPSPSQSTESSATGAFTTGSFRQRAGFRLRRHADAPDRVHDYPVLPEDLQWSGPVAGNVVVERFLVGEGAWVGIGDPLVMLRSESGPVTLWSTYIGQVETLYYQQGQPLVPGRPVLTLAVSGWLFR